MKKIFLNKDYSVDLLKQVFLACIHNIVSMAGVRHRHVLTKNNTIRMRYVGVSFMVSLVCLSFLYAVSKEPLRALGHSISVIAFNQSDALDSPNMIEPASGKDSLGLNTKPTLYNQTTLAAMMTKATPHPAERVVTIEAGDALGVVLEREGLGEDTPEAVKVISEYIDPKQIRAGQEIHLKFEPTANNNFKFSHLKMKIDQLKTVIVKKNNNNMVAELSEKEVTRSIQAKKAEIETSLYGSAGKAGIPKGVVADAMRIYSWNVDFQRDLRKGDTIEIMYESFQTEDGYVAKTGNILYANLTVGGREIPLYRFELVDGRTDYFQPDGWNIKRTLMKTPVDGARMSSGYGMRRHPVLGYNKMHKGLDFAAPTGTPIYAAGDGYVEKAGWFSSYGKYVKIRHNSKLQTAYAHMSKIKVAQGSRVKQGEIIGYVGTTGRSTGAHLHYEVHVNGHQTNPRSVNLPTGEKLAGSDFNKFKIMMKDANRQFIALLNTKKYAQATIPSVVKSDLN